MQKLPTMDEREPSSCAKKTEDGKGLKKAKGMYWPGMNDRDETDPATMQPVGRMLKEGFDLLSDDPVNEEN